MFENLMLHKRLEKSLPFIYDDGVFSDTYPKMLNCHLSVPEEIPHGKAIVFDIGGTNYRSAIVSFDESGLAKVERFVTKNISFGTFDGFIDILAADARALKSADPEISRIGICFSHPFECMENHDGRILSLSKEVVMDGAVGRLIGASLMERSDCAKLGFVVINDAAAAVVFAKYGNPSLNLEKSLVYGVIVGTGNNIGLLKGENGKYEIVNTEIGQTDIGDGQVLEHIAGGKYMYRNVAAELKRLKIQNIMRLNSTADLGMLLTIGSDETKKCTKRVIGDIAKVEADALDALIVYQMEREGKKDVCINVEGTVYECLDDFRNALHESVMNNAAKHGYVVNFAKSAEHSVLIATAMAALSVISYQIYV